MAREVRFKKELLDELLAGQDAKTVFEQDGLLDDLKRALAERILNAEMDHHLGQDDEQAAGNRTSRQVRSRRTSLRSLAAFPTSVGGDNVQEHILLSDGTGNSAAKLFKTNVWRLYEAVDLTDPQVPTEPRQYAFYDNGVGTSSLRPLAALGGALGVGLARNVRDLLVAKS